MKLTDQQKAEVRNYIITVPKYRETYNELYDHILNSLSDNENEYSINEVISIINNDFGGFEKIASQEEIYHNKIGKKFNKQFRLLFFDALKWQGIGILIIGFIIYYVNKTSPFNVKPIISASTICFVVVAIYGYARIIINAIRYAKYSILDSYLGHKCSFGLAILNVLLHGFINGKVIELSDNNKLIAVLILFSLASLYARTIIKFYAQRSNILMA